MTLWGGRFSGKLDPGAWQLNTSLPVDQRMAEQDVRGSLAWAAALVQAGVLTQEEGAELQTGLQAVLAEFQAKSFVFSESDEDIHTAVERRLAELVGPVAGKLHTGRSRNDQVATDFRLWLLEALPTLETHVASLQAALVARASSDMGILLPGYTHMQRAQPVLLSHWWLSHFWALQRDRQRQGELAAHTAVLPLGSGALAGAPFALDRHSLANALGFAAPCQNSIDGVADRDFAVEFTFWASLTASHLSRLAEAVIIFSSAEFGFFELSDAYSTGSSLMPQKKNPDVFELARGKAGTLLGVHAGLLATLKGLPSAYDKDLQEDKAAVFTAYDTLSALLPVLAGAIQTLTVRPVRMRQGLDAGMLATDLADYLVAKGIPFREAHGLAGQAVRTAADAGCGLDQLPIDIYHQIHPAFGSDIYSVFDPVMSVERRAAYGGTSPGAVQAQLAEAQSILNQTFLSK